VQLIGAPARRVGCSPDRGWRVRVGAREARLRWRAPGTRPCAGRYVFRVVAVATGGAARVDCERRADRDAVKGPAPEAGCARREVVGEAAVVIGA
jgi:hypothetical protein